MSALLRYAVDHWRGRLDLWRSFWLNFVALSIGVFALEPLCFPPYVNGETGVTVAVLAYLLLGKLALFPWQAIGVLRASAPLARSDRLRLAAIQASVVTAFGVVLLAAIGTLQSLQHYRQSLLVPAAAEPGYRLEWLPESGWLHLAGSLDPGVTSRLAAWIEAYPRARGVIIDSDGGQVYEGRGLALQIRLHGLDTHSSADCLSACTTAFIAGKRRTLGPGARLGFHQYRSYVGYPRIDVDEEQRKDREIFLDQGVAVDFIERMHGHTADAMWWPTATELIDAGVVHAVGVEAGG